MPDHLDDLIGLDFTRRSLAAESVSDLVEAFLCLFPRRLFRVLQILDVGLKQVRDRARAGVTGDLDAAALLDQVGKVAGEYLPRLAE